jgi:LPXTG-site transpeptidase (sortase) family protein
MVLASLFMIGKTFYQPVLEETRYFVDKYFQKTYIVSTNPEDSEKKSTAAKGSLAKLLNLKRVEILVPEDPEFSIVIPKIGANSRIVPNVDAADEESYLKDLKKGVAHAKGTAFPGEQSHIFLFAHSADNIFDIGTYNAVFYLLYKLEKGDEVTLFYQNQRYTYRVVDKKIVDPSEVEYLTRKTEGEFLTLQTCYPPGTVLKRMLIFATRVSE